MTETFDGGPVVEKLKLNETDAVIGNNWPEHDERSYRREAAKQLASALQASQMRESALDVSSYTEEEFKGLSGTSLDEAMQLRAAAFAASEARHVTTAEHMSQAANRIADTKNRMNDAQSAYHDEFGQACRASAAEGWYQGKLNQERSSLLERAQLRVREERSALDRYLGETVSRIEAAAAEVEVPQTTPPGSGQARLVSDIHYDYYLDDPEYQASVPREEDSGTKPAPEYQPKPDPRSFVPNITWN